MKPKPTPEQKKALIADRANHQDWLQKHSIADPGMPVRETSYTGLLLSAFLDPDAAATVAWSLRGGGGGVPRRQHVTAVGSPTKGADLLVRLGGSSAEWVLVLEHKRFGSPTHRPGYRRDPESPWQSDVIYAEIAATSPPEWLVRAHPSHEKVFLVLDAYGMSMEQMFPGGEHNSRWTVTSYPQFGAGLREAHRRGTRGLVPLLAALYCGST